MELLAAWLVIFPLLALGWFFLIKRPSVNAEVEADIREDQRRLVELGDPGWRQGDWLNEAQAAYLDARHAQTDREVAFEIAKTRITQARMATKGPWLAWAGAAIVGVGAYEAFEHHREAEWDQHDGGFDAVDLDNLR